jgi:hypothetical protein
MFDNTGKADNWLRGVAAIPKKPGAKGVGGWAVGHYGDYLGSTGTGSRSLILSWDGASWATVATQPIGFEDRLHGVAMISANNVWAVGMYTDYSSDYVLIQHWDGYIWKVMPAPRLKLNSNWLYSVCGISANDSWAVGGSTQDGLIWQPLILHWDGSTWRHIKGAGVGTLHGISAVSETDIWAVGWTTGLGLAKPLVLHWDGTKWSAIANPILPNIARLNAVSAVSGSDVWAAGAVWNGTTFQTLVEHWDGNAWTVFPSP